MAEKLKSDHRRNTQIQRYWLPIIRAAIELHRGKYRADVKALENAAGVDLALTLPFANSLIYPPYLRAQAMMHIGRIEESERDLKRIIDQPGQVKNFIVYPLAIVEYSKLVHIDDREAEALAMRERFLAPWKNRDEALDSFGETDRA